MQIDVADLLGLRYKEHGRDKSGLDCFGLVIEVSKRFGHDLPDFPYKKGDWKVFSEKKEDIKKRGLLKEVKKAEQGGDLILFKVNSSFENHIGVFLGEENLFIHCDKFGVHIQNLMDYKANIGSVYRWL